MKGSYFFFSLSFCLAYTCSLVYAQGFIVKGAVYEKGTNIRIALAEVTNKNTGLGTLSNNLGIFEIRAALGDIFADCQKKFDLSANNGSRQSGYHYLFG